MKLLSRGPDGWSQASELSCQRADGRTGGVYTPGERVGGTLGLQQVGGLGRGLGRWLTPAGIAGGFAPIPHALSFLESPRDRGAWQATVHGLQRVGHG